MLAWNQRKVRQLGPGEIWLFIIGRVLAAFGLGVLATRNFPDLIGPLGLPAAVVGVVLLFVASRGLFRTQSSSE
ncbi:MAG TPA: hypothetical protein VF041_02565 [Gemmatimonadaceae bacterium]